MRDFSFYQAVIGNNFKKVYRSLENLTRMLRMANSNKESDEIMVLMTSSATFLFGLPEQGYKWKSVDSLLKNLKFKKKSLMSTVWVKGPSAKNFCGVYNESDILEKML